MIDAHINTIEGNELDKSIICTLKASGDALKRCGVSGGAQSVQDIISEIEQEMDNAAEITRTLANGVSMGHLITNSMSGGLGGEVVDDEVLQNELDEFLCDEESVSRAEEAVSDNKQTYASTSGRWSKRLLSSTPRTPLLPYSTPAAVSPLPGRVAVHESGGGVGSDRERERVT